MVRGCKANENNMCILLGNTVFWDFRLSLPEPKYLLVISVCCNYAILKRKYVWMTECWVQLTVVFFLIARVASRWELQQHVFCYINTHNISHGACMCSLHNSRSQQTVSTNSLRCLAYNLIINRAICEFRLGALCWLEWVMTVFWFWPNVSDYHAKNLLSDTCTLRSKVQRVTSKDTISKDMLCPVIVWYEAVSTHAN